MSEAQGGILVVDDNEMNRDMLARRLGRLDYKVTLAESGRVALNLLVDKEFDIVLLDIMMPDMDGITVLKLIRKTFSPTELPVIMVTAKGESEDIVNALELGANDYITKPLNFKIVSARVKAHLSLKLSNDENNILVEQLEAKNDFIRKIFGRYVASEVVDKVLENPEALKFDGELMRVSIMFADIRGFASISENLAPAQILSLLNNYLGVMTNIISKNRGTVDEILGDGLMAFFGAAIAEEEHAQRAVACGIEMQLAMGSVNEKNASKGLPEMKMGIGINTGEVVVGNIGSEHRSKFSVIGSHVNLASRIESQTKGDQILISEYTLADTGAVVKIGAQIEVQPKGLKNHITLYEVVGIGGEHNLFLSPANA